MISLVGPIPPPTTGMAIINSRIKTILEARSIAAMSIDTAPAPSRHPRIQKLQRILKVAPGLARFLWITPKLRCMYSSVSGGLGQAYELAFVTLARAASARIILHHHCFYYLYSKKWLAHILCKIAGPNALHVTQSPGMSMKLRELYGVKHTLAVSNAVIIEIPVVDVPTKQQAQTIGYLSNISEEKGIFEFLKVARHFHERNCNVRFVIAGPFDTKGVELAVHEELFSLPNTSYIGPVHGQAKSDFFHAIDIFLFPTLYRNETEGIVNHEAMMHGVPVIAYGRGCIPEIIGNRAGVVIDPKESFLPKASHTIERWLNAPHEYQSFSSGAKQQFAMLKERYEINLEELISELSKHQIMI